MSDRKKKLSFEEEKKQWLNESLNRFNKDIALSLKYKSLATIVRDSNNDNLLKINALLQSEMQKRGTPVTVALTDDDYEDLYFDLNIGNRAQSVAIARYIKRNYKDITRKQRKNLVAVLYDNLAETGEDDEEDDEKMVSVAEKEKFKKLYETDKGIDDDEYDDLLGWLQDGELNAYMYKYEDPVELAIIVKQLHDEGIKTKHVMLYTFNLPLGKDYIIENDGQYGQYVIIVDKSISDKIE